MSKFSQNKRIAISAIAIFVVSFSVMLMFLNGGKGIDDKGATNVFMIGEYEEVAAEDIVLSLDEPMFVTTPDGLFVSVNRHFCGLIGRSCKALSGEKFFEFVNSRDLPDLLTEFTKLVRDGGEVDAAGPFRLVNGSQEILVILSAEAIIGEEGKVDNLVFTVKDITKQVEEISEPREDSWYERLYPKVKDMDNQDSKLIVEKVI